MSCRDVELMGNSINDDPRGTIDFEFEKVAYYFKDGVNYKA